MKVELRADVKESNSPHRILFLLSLATYENRYDMFVDLEGFNALRPILDDTDRKTLEERFQRWITNGNPRADLVVSESGQLEQFALEEAITFLSQPFKILLENSDNDAHFLNALLKHFSKRGKKVRRFKEHLFLEYANAGGKSNVEHFVNGELSKFRSLPKSPERYLRLFVLVDSDREFAGNEKPEVTKLKTFLESLSIPYHILSKREMENYLPDEAVETSKGNADFIQAYLKLKPEQKDYFDLQNGFLDKNRSQLEREKGDAFRLLYDSVSEGDWQTFRNQDFGLPNFKNELPRLFETEQVTQERLQARVAHQDDPNEIRDLLDAITRCL